MIRRAAKSLLLAGVLCASPARAATRPPRTITRVEVTGNTRTATRVIERALRVAPGDVVEPGPASGLAQRVMNLRLFQEVEAWVEDDGAAGAVVHVKVRERWTLLPLPMVSGSGDRMQAGLLVLDSNFLGQGVVFGVGGVRPMAKSSSRSTAPRMPAGSPWAGARETRSGWEEAGGSRTTMSPPWRATRSLAPPACCRDRWSSCSSGRPTFTWTTSLGGRSGCPSTRRWTR